ncbi:MAG: hypothetical protein KIS87_02005 [Phycisphaeraceae bacterium]|nr:hypothetical protein [Phycisphaeraceae bacterium]
MIQTRDYDEAVKSLAREHASVDPSIKRIISYDDPDRRVVRFIEVSDAELPPENGLVSAVRFGKSDAFPFVVEVALLSEEDWRRVESGSLRLPESWGGASPRRVFG